MGTIANLVVMLIADSSKMSAGFQAAENRIKQFSATAGKSTGAVANAFRSPLAAVENLVGKIPLIGSAMALLPAAGAAFESMWKSAAAPVIALRDQSVKLGDSVENLQPIMAVAGDNADVYAVGLAKMQKLIGEAAAGEQKQQVALGRLGLKYEDLIDLPVSQQFLKIGDALKQVNNATQKTQFGMDIFGGKTLPNMRKGLDMGSAGADAMAAKIDSLGGKISSADAEAIHSTQKKLKEIKKLQEAREAQLAVEAAPIAEGWAQSKLSALKFFSGDWEMFKGPKNVPDTSYMWKKDQKQKPFEKDLTEVTAKSLEYTQKLDDLTRAYGQNSHMVELNALARKGATADMLAGARAKMDEIDALNKITDGASKSLNIFQDFSAKATALQAAFDAGKISADGFAGGMAKINEAMDKQSIARAAEVFKSVASAQEQYAAKVQELGGLLQRGDVDFQTFSRAVGTATTALQDTPTQSLNIFEDYRQKVNSLGAAFDAMGLQAAGMSGGFDSLDATMKKSMFVKGAEVFKSVATPLEQMDAKIEELDGLLLNGAISWETYERAVSAAGKAITDLNKSQETRLAGSAAFGSQDAYSAIAKASGPGAQGGLATLKDAIKAQLDVQKRQQRDLDDIARAARGGFLKVGVIR